MKGTGAKAPNFRSTLAVRLFTKPLQSSIITEFHDFIFKYPSADLAFSEEKWLKGF